MLVGFLKVIFWAWELQPVVWLWLFKWTSRFQTGHKRLWFIQSLIIEIRCKQPQSALNMWFLLMSALSRRRPSAARLHLFVESRRAVWWVVSTCLTPLSGDVIPLRLKITMQILLSGPGSGDQGLGYQQIHHLWTYASLPVPPAKSSPLLLPGPG